MGQGVSPECGAACSMGILGLAGATIYSLYSRSLAGEGVNRRLGVQKRMSVAETLFLRAAQRRDSEARRSILEGIRSRFDKMKNWFSTVQERQDSQAQQNKAALSSWVNGMVAKARSLSKW